MIFQLVAILQFLMQDFCFWVALLSKGEFLNHAVSGLMNFMEFKWYRFRLVLPVLVLADEQEGFKRHTQSPKELFFLCEFGFVIK